MNPRQIADRVDRALASAGPTPWLVGYDANGIQELIAACGRPVAMRGASEKIVAFDLEARRSGLAIFAGGGRGIVLARSEDDARAAARGFIENYREATKGGVMAACYVPFDPNAQAQSIRWLRRRLEIDKDAARPPAGTLPTSKETECAYCRRYRGVKRDERDGQVEMICTRCDAMLVNGRKIGKQRGSRRGEMSRSLEEFAENGWIAAITADGNNLGALFDSLSSLVELAAVSEAVKVIFERAHAKALEHIPEDERIPLMTGGDDVRAFLSPRHVLDYVKILTSTVEEAAGEQAKALCGQISNDAAKALDRLGVGVGAVIANLYFPAWRLMDYAHALERHAKAACYPDDIGRARRSAFDFAVVTAEEAMTVEPGERRDLNDIRPLSPACTTFVDTLRKTCALRKIPAAQLNILIENQTDDNAAELANRLRYQVARSSDWKAWYEACGVDWRDPDAVFKHRPDRGSLELVRLLDWCEPRGEVRS